MEITTNTPTTKPQTVESTPKTDQTVLSSDFETFLKMLTAQARYQDPLEPIDSTEYAAQLAQFSSVEQQVKSNDLLSGIAAQLGASNMASYAGWIGMDARSTGPVYFDGTAIPLTPKPAAAADEVWLVVRNEAGSEVQRKQIPQDAENIEWAGVDNNGAAFPEGLYQLSIESRAQGEVIRTDAAETYSRVTEARSDDGKAELVLRGGTVVSPGDISALRAAQS